MKKLTTWLLVLLLCVSIAGCGGEETGSNAGKTGTNKTEARDYNWSQVKMKDVLPLPEATSGRINQNSSEVFSMTLLGTTLPKYEAYKKACETKGFIVDPVTEDNRYEALNKLGMKLTLEFLPSEISMEIKLERLVVSTVQWSTLTLCNYLPTPANLAFKGHISENTDKNCRLSMGSITKEAYTKYVSDCQVKGYTGTADDTSFTGTNIAGATLELKYYPNAGILCITLNTQLS